MFLLLCSMYQARPGSNGDDGNKGERGGAKVLKA